MVWRKYPKEKPNEMVRLVVKDKYGKVQGHLNTKIMFDGKKFGTNLASVLKVDVENIVEWCYLSEI